jgi:hypothetical protein
MVSCFWLFRDNLSLLISLAWKGITRKKTQRRKERKDAEHGELR